ncbi:hypothetical protein AB0I81_24915 [Nonomuraea sp. NPDC050404]|uniref:hypothetical protein n=1 Tax=Nonomuraea sp. NPDC050404 TaxID=3155783 RepID=UPI00340FE057
MFLKRAVIGLSIALAALGGVALPSAASASLLASETFVGSGAGEFPPHALRMARADAFGQARAAGYLSCHVVDTDVHFDSGVGLYEATYTITCP